MNQTIARSAAIEAWRHAWRRAGHFNRLGLIVLIAVFAVLTVKAQTATPLEKAMHRIELNQVSETTP